MSNHGFKLSQGVGEGDYEVMDNGVRVAEVSKRSSYYNIARPVTMRWWSLRVPGHPTGKFETRGDALEWLRDLLNKKEGSNV